MHACALFDWQLVMTCVGGLYYLVTSLSLLKFNHKLFSTCEDLQVVWTQNASWRKPLVSKLNYMAAYRMKSMLVWMKSFEVNLCWLLIKSSSWVYTSNFLLTSFSLTNLLVEKLACLLLNKETRQQYRVNFARARGKEYFSASFTEMTLPSA